MLFLSGCAALPQVVHQEMRNQVIIDDVKTNLTGMSDEEINEYFQEMIARRNIFIYTGGYANTPLIRPEDWEVVKSYTPVSVGCSGGVEEASKFNKLVIEYLRRSGAQTPTR